MSIAKKIQYNTLVLAVIVPLLFTGQLAYGQEQGQEEAENPTPLQKRLIITTIKPLAIIAKSAVGDYARVEYLQSAAQSAHEVSLPVSALKKIEQADLIVWIGFGFEARIAKPMALLPEAKRITVMELDLLSAEQNVGGEVHQHEHFQLDPHIWLNPANGNIVANSIQQRLGLPITPIISTALIEQLKAELYPYSDKNYLSHHDALGHFSAAFDLRKGLAIRDASGASQGARSQFLLRQLATELSVECIFVEPQYADKDARVVARELKLPLAVLDPQGFNQPLTADSYRKFMIGLAAQFKACFE